MCACFGGNAITTISISISSIETFLQCLAVVCFFSVFYLCTIFAFFLEIYMVTFIFVLLYI